MSDKPISLIQRKDESVKNTIQEMLDRAEHFAGVVIIAQNKDGTQYLRISDMSSQMKASCYCLFQAFINEHFSAQDETK